MFQDHRKKDIKTSHNATLGMLLYWGSHIAHIYIFSTLTMYSHIKIKRWAPIPLIITFQYFCISDGHPFSLPLEHSCPLRGWKKFRWGEGVALVPPEISRGDGNLLLSLSSVILAAFYLYALCIFQYEFFYGGWVWWLSHVKRLTERERDIPIFVSKCENSRVRVVNWYCRQSIFINFKSE